MVVLSTQIKQTEKKYIGTSFEDHSHQKYATNKKRNLSENKFGPSDSGFLLILTSNTQKCAAFIRPSYISSCAQISSHIRLLKTIHFQRTGIVCKSSLILLSTGNLLSIMKPGNQNGWWPINFALQYSRRTQLTICFFQFSCERRRYNTIWIYFKIKIKIKVTIQGS